MEPQPPSEGSPSSFVRPKSPRMPSREQSMQEFCEQDGARPRENALAHQRLIAPSGSGPRHSIQAREHDIRAPESDDGSGSATVPFQVLAAL